ncbi:MAG: Hsp20/alpha crystallin family protein [Lachnospiraceae bacterium]|uniref:Hsp20/alpha crystallin family protein n=1 Tax=Candidatus Weimeria bifida TaxID=2599074 RepID=A0A6N7IYX9_9FIRM|nr:Hsp20/alpha crystallin family protein [Candidatus Weimeria bifida]RRF94885.1 MAG: Hsp20/alpha crystallin family protein [Lachnospiraceae bacterium]
MAYLPGFFGENLLDDFMDSVDQFWNGPSVRSASNAAYGLMRTDIKENGNNYELSVELPGFDKSDISVELKDGYLNLSAKHSENKEDKDNEGKVLRQERYSGSVARSFYVGEDLKQEDVHAKYDNGILELTFPKQEAREKLPESHIIEIQ